MLLMSSLALSSEQAVKLFGGRGVRFNLTNRDEEPRKQMEDFTQNGLKTLRQTDSSIVSFNDDWTMKEIDSMVSIT